MLTVNTQTLAGTYEYVVKADPAVDTECDDFEEKWRLYSDGQGSPPLKAGQSPTVFKLRHLRGRDENKMSPYLGRAGTKPEYMQDALYAVARIVLVGWDNMRDTGGQLVKMRTTTDDDGERVVSLDSMDLLSFGVIAEIAAVALDRRNGDPL